MVRVKVKELREAYEEAVKTKQEKFIFHKMEFLTTYVKYLLDYTERLHMKEETYINLSTEMYKKIFTLEELTNGIKYYEFVEKITSELRKVINDKLDNIDRTYAGLSQNYKEGVDEGLKVALWFLRGKK